MREPPLSGKEIVQEVERLVFDFNSNPSADGTPATGNKLTARLFEEQPSIPMRNKPLIASDRVLRPKLTKAVTVSSAQVGNTTEPCYVDELDVLNQFHQCARAFSAKITSKKSFEGR